MMMYKIKRWTLLAILGTLIFTFFSCKKDPTKVGLEVQSGTSEMDLNYDDSTVTLSAYTVKRDSMNTTNITYFVLGSLNNPDFGTTQAAFNTNFRLESTQPSFGSNPTVDSICLQLSYAGFWGDSTTEFTVKAYQLLETLILEGEKEFDASSEITYDQTPVGTKTFVPKFSDSVVIRGIRHLPLLQFRLDDLFGSEMLGDSSNFASNDDFVKNFHGLRIGVEPVNNFGNMIYFKPTSSDTRMILYYHNAEADSLSYSFVINENCTWFNNYYQDYTNSDLNFEFGNHQDIESANEKLYLQPFIGTRIQLDFSGLEKLRDKENIVLNEVKLILKNDNEYDKTMPPPSRFVIYAVDGESEVFIRDLETSSYFDGNYNQSQNQYTMRLTRYFQQRLLNPVMDNDVLYLQIIGGAYNANSVVLEGNNFTSLRIYYTEF